MPSVAELIRALPAEEDETVGEETPVPREVEKYMTRPVPIGRLRRMRLLGTLQAKIAAAYLFYWIRGWFKNADEKEKLLAETHWRTAVRLLDSMNYLRGAVMKVGQTLANYPDVAPDALVETLESLHASARPMHWSLLKEMVTGELGDEPEKLFASFDRTAFAAASLGQVHRARLHSGGDVAVKIQYPGIGRTIREDFRNLLLVLLPGRLTKDWQNTKDQFDDLRRRLEEETDYEREADLLERARSVFREDDGIVVPRVHRRHSTSRVLTMDYLEGMHIDQFVDHDPPQELRNEVGRKLLRAWYRLMYAGRLVYVDFHPGNFLVMRDGRVGILDFGFMLPLDDALWEYFRKIDRGLTTGSREERIQAIKEWTWTPDEPSEEERLRLCEAYADWSWRSRYCGGEFDFGDEADFREGVDLFAEMMRKRLNRGRPSSPTICRGQMGWRAILYRLKAKINVREIAEEEVKTAGWDRSDYA